jgi:hypothetical protein
MQLAMLMINVEIKQKIIQYIYPNMSWPSWKN